MTEANYYQTFGMIEKSFEMLQHLIPKALCR